MWKMIIFYNLMSDKLASEDVLYTTENQRLCLISGGMCVWGGGGGRGRTENPVSSAEGWEAQVLAQSVIQVEIQTLSLISSGTWNLVSWSLHFLIYKMGAITPMPKTVTELNRIIHGKHLAERPAHGR